MTSKFSADRFEMLLRLKTELEDAAKRVDDLIDVGYFNESGIDLAKAESALRNNLLASMELTGLHTSHQVLTREQEASLRAGKTTYIPLSIGDKSRRYGGRGGAIRDAVRKMALWRNMPSHYDTRLVALSDDVDDNGDPVIHASGNQVARAQRENPHLVAAIEIKFRA